jgi:hypothetical protein
MGANGRRELGEIPLTSESYLACSVLFDAECASCWAKAYVECEMVKALAELLIFGTKHLGKKY